MLLVIQPEPHRLIPPGRRLFCLIDSAPGVDLYRKEYAGVHRLYNRDRPFQNRIRLLHGAVADAGAGTGAWRE
jgi:hypothetical protein